MSLADELLADLEENETEDLDLIKEEEDAQEEAVELEIHDELMDIDVKVVYLHLQFCNTLIVFNHYFKVSSIRELCKLRDSEELKNILIQIDKYMSNPRKSNEMIGNVESDPEYQLIVEANSIAVDIDNEICKKLLINYQ